MDLNINLLLEASDLILLQNFTYKKFVSYSINNLGVKIPTYSEETQAKGSIQEIQLSLYQQYGFDLTKDYRTIHTQADVYGTEKQEQPDIVIYDNYIWSVIKCQPWREYNGWNEVVIVREKVNKTEQEEENVNQDNQ